MGSRRKFIRSSLLLAPISGVLLYRCSQRQPETKIDPCTDLSDLSDDEMAVRDQLGYMDQSSLADRNCANCNLFLKSDDTLACGSCLAMKGPVADDGYCTIWAPVT